MVTAAKSKLTQFIKSIRADISVMYHTYISLTWMTRISLSAQVINHNTTLRVHPCVAKNTPEIGHVSLSFIHKVIFQSSPLCSGGGYTLGIHRHTYSPRTTRIWPLDSDITFVIMRIYILPDPMYSVYCGRCTCSPAIACIPGTGFAWPRRTMCRPSINQDTRYLDFFL